MTTPSRARASALPGFSVLLDKELLEARRSKRMLLFLLAMTACLVLVATVGYLRIEHFGTGGRHRVSGDGMDTLLASWTALVGFLGSLMVIASTVDAMSRERSLGISAWIVTKPVSRLSYLGAKAVAHSLIAIAMLVALPTAIWLAMMLALFQDVPLARIGAATLVLCVEMGFLSFFIVALGVPFRSVPPIAMTGLGVWFLPNFVPVIASLRWTYHLLPSYLPFVALRFAVADHTRAYQYTVPLASIGIAAALFAAAVVMFERQEL
jgi:ABC-type transport system involved in multi-copper enzyme maturation permease subunit